MSCKKANQLSKGPSRSQPPAKPQQPLWTTEITQIAIEKKTEKEVQSKNGGAQLEHCSTIRYGLGVFEVPLAKNPLPTTALATGL